MKNPEKVSWIERALDTHKFHIKKMREDEKWRLSNTSKALNRSLGSICEDLLIASWYKTHKVQLEKFEYAKEALEFIRERQKQMQIEEIE